MSELLKTYPVAPPSIGLALMAWHLAWTRAYVNETPGMVAPFERGSAGHATRHYYEIIDRLSRGETP